MRIKTDSIGKLLVSRDEHLIKEIPASLDAIHFTTKKGISSVSILLSLIHRDC